MRNIAAWHKSTNHVVARKKLAVGAVISVGAMIAAVLGMSSPVFAIGGITGVNIISLMPTTAGATAAYGIQFDTLNADAIGDSIIITAPAGTVFPVGVGSQADYTVDSNSDGLNHPTLAPTQSAANNVTIVTPVALISEGFETDVRIAGVINPSTPSTTETLTVSTTNNTAGTSSDYTIGAPATAVTAVGVTSVVPSTAGLATAAYTVHFVATTALVGGTDMVTFTGPSGTIFPLDDTKYTVRDGSGTATAVAVTPTGTAGNVTFKTPVSVTAGDVVTVVASGVTNPVAGPYNLSVNTSKDVTPVATSSTYSITAAADAPTSTITASLPSITANGSSTSTITVQAKASGGANLTASGGLVSLSSTLGGTIGTVTDNGDGTYTAQLTAGTTVGPAAITGLINDSVIGHPASIDFTARISTPTPTPTPSPTPTPTPVAPVRLAGVDLFGNAVATSVQEFPTSGRAAAVVLARSDDFADALVGTTLAAEKNAPLLFAEGSVLTTATQAEIARVLPAGGTVYLLGGIDAIPAAVVTTLSSVGYVPVRYFGADRFSTSVAVADALGDPSTVLLATGTNFPDALAAGSAAAHLGGVVLLTDGSTIPSSVQAYLTAHPGKVYAVGGPAVAADPLATPLAGADRYSTAAALATAIFTAPTNVGVASGVAFTDALSGGSFEAYVGGPLLLSEPATLPASTTTYLTDAKSTVVTSDIFGGTDALSGTVQTAVGTALGSM